MAETNLFDLAEEITARLNADDYFADVKAIANRAGDVLTELNKSLGLQTKKGGKLGACMLVAPIAADEANINALFGPMDIEISVICFEHVQLNKGQQGTNKPGFAIARRAHRVCKLYQPINMATPLTPVKPTIRPAAQALSLLGLELTGDIQAWEVRFRAREQDPTVNRKVTLPSITIDEETGLVTMACETPGAAIYYTLDGSPPYSSNSAAVLYQEPFSPESQGVVIRAAAAKAGWIASDAAWAEYLFQLAGESGAPILAEDGTPIIA